MPIDAPNYQYPAGIPPTTTDRGTVILVVGPDGNYTPVYMATVLDLLGQILLALQDIRAALPSQLQNDRLKVKTGN